MHAMVVIAIITVSCARWRHQRAPARNRRHDAHINRGDGHGVRSARVSMRRGGVGDITLHIPRSSGITGGRVSIRTTAVGIPRRTPGGSGICRDAAAPIGETLVCWIAHEPEHFKFVETRDYMIRKPSRHRSSHECFPDHRSRGAVPRCCSDRADERVSVAENREVVDAEVLSVGAVSSGSVCAPAVESVLWINNISPRVRDASRGRRMDSRLRRLGIFVAVEYWLGGTRQLGALDPWSPIEWTTRGPTGRSPVRDSGGQIEHDTADIEGLHYSRGPAHRNEQCRVTLVIRTIGGAGRDNQELASER